MVVAPDQRGRGSSDPAAFADGFGGPDSLAYLHSLPFVDAQNIGLEGHSMGGWAVLAAARSNPDGYRAMVLEGSRSAPPFAAERQPLPEKSPGGVRHLRRIRRIHVGTGIPDAHGRDCEGHDIVRDHGARRAGTRYGDIEAGTARELLTPRMTHAWLHHSPTAIASAPGLVRSHAERPATTAAHRPGVAMEGSGYDAGSSRHRAFPRWPVRPPGAPTGARAVALFAS